MEFTIIPDGGGLHGYFAENYPHAKALVESYKASFKRENGL